MHLTMVTMDPLVVFDEAQRSDGHRLPVGSNRRDDIRIGQAQQGEGFVGQGFGRHTYSSGARRDRRPQAGWSTP